MNPYVADPEWGWWIILYFFLGGIAAGAYFTATLIDLFGSEEDGELARVGYWVAFPLVSLCGLFLTVDLNQPQRFWHMLFKSELVHRALDEGWPLGGWDLMLQAPLLKYWSPMSMGSWALLIFGFCSFLTLVGSLWPAGRLAWLFRRSLLARVLQVVGCLVGFFVAAYTGALLTATNQPLWSDSTWIAPLFLTSAASTGMAVIILLAHSRKRIPAASLDRLERADWCALGLEAVVFVLFLVSLGPLLEPLWSVWQGKLFVVSTAALGLLFPLALHLRPGAPARVAVPNALAAAVFSLAGGFLLRYGILTTPPALLARGPAKVPAEAARQTSPEGLPGFSPEDDREPGKSLGADPLNRLRPDDPDDILPRSKAFRKP
jgi:formate-dependent nitrite reductase membrane component NrfD